MEYTSQYTVDIPDDVTLPEFVIQKMSSYGDRIALIDDKSGGTITYTDFVSTCKRLATNLHRHGIRHGDVIIIYGPNCIEYPVIFYGVMLCGAIAMGLSHGCTKYEINGKIADSSAKYVFTTKDLHAKLVESCEGLTCVKEIFTIGESVSGCLTYGDLIQSDIDLPKVPIDPKKDGCILNYSSGTTGMPKPILLTHYNWIADICRLIHESIISVREGCDVTLVQRPLFHAYGQIFHVTMGCYQGMTHVIPPDGSPLTTLNLIQKHKVTVLALTPISMNALVQEPTAPQYDLSSVRSVFCAGCPLSPITYNTFRKIFGAPDIRNAHGMSETLITLVSKVNSVGHSLGTVMPNGRAKIVDVTTMETLDKNQQGELLFKGPTICSGYYGRPEANKTTFTPDGWFRTGDIAIVDDDGNFHVKDRLKELIKFQTNRVVPAEVEGVIQGHPGVHEVAVVGKPDPDYPDWKDFPISELPTAFVTRKAGCDVTETDIVNYVKERLEDYHHLRGGVIFTDDIPVSAGGKILRRILRDQLRAEYLANRTK